MSGNPTIGMVVCPLCDEPAAVRKDKAGRFYYISAAGRISPSSEFGQRWFVENATIWGSGAPGDDVPEWIAEGRSWPENSVSRHRSTRKAAEPETVADGPADAIDLTHANDLLKNTGDDVRDEGFLDGFFGDD